MSVSAAQPSSRGLGAAAEYRSGYVARLLAAHGPGAAGAAAMLAAPGMAREQLPRDADHLIAPFRLGKEEKNFKSGLLAIATGNYDNVRLQEFPKDKLLPHLVFHKPVQPDAEAWRAVETALGKKAGGGAPAAAQKRQRQSGGGASASSYASGAAGSQYSAQEVAGGGGGAAKRPRTESRRKSGADAGAGMMFMPLEDSLQQQHRVPENMFEVLQGVFDAFWDLDVDPAISTPFFALITRQSCGPSFGMPDYFSKVTEACTLVNIKEKLDQRLYRSVEEFEFDFMAMCENVFLYFPAQSPQYAKAAELRAMFLSLWGPAKAKLRYASG